MADLAGEDLNAPEKTEEDQNTHTTSDAEPEGVDPDEIELVKPEWLPDKFWSEENGIDNEKMASTFNKLYEQY